MSHFIKNLKAFQEKKKKKEEAAAQWFITHN